MISIIIPAYNEQGYIGKTVSNIFNDKRNDLIKEVIVVDGGSNDNTVDEARSAGAAVISGKKKGRAAQMNQGASIAIAPVLHFIHADSITPQGFPADIINAVNNGFVSGCFRLAFDHKHWFLKANCWFTRFDINAFHYGDQSLFVTRDVFEKVNGFNENFIVFEDIDMIRRIRKHANFKIMSNRIITSARKYIDNGVYKMQMVFYLMYIFERCGAPQQRLVRMLRSMVKQDKI